MQWNDLSPSQLAQMLKAKKLNHPTSDAFDSSKWEAAIGAMDSPGERDFDLAMSAIYFGRELASLRKFAIPLTTREQSRSRLLRLLAAFANQQYLTLRAKALKALKSQKGEVFDLERAPQIFVEGAGGQEMAPDDLITYLIDSIPHWLFHIWNVSDDEESECPPLTIDFAARASAIVSIEHSLRTLWLNALWTGTTLVEDDDALIDVPRDKHLAERWFVFDQRQMMLMMTDHHLTAGASIISGGRLAPVVPPNARTVIRMERQPTGNRKFITGQASGIKAEQRDHASELDMLERLYTGLFLDETLPKSYNGALTCRELNSAWWVLKDLARVASAKLGEAWMPNEKAIDQFALTVRLADLGSIFMDCLNIDEDRAQAIIDWLTCDPGDTARIFAKSIWSEPLLPALTSDSRHIIIAPLLVGSPVKRVEAWMERGGISDSNGIKGRGKPFEKYVRGALAEAIAGNPLLMDTAVAAHGLKRKNDSEEIDLLIRIGDAVIVGEVKCYTAPSEAIEKHNHLRNLAHATEQAENKRNWAAANLEVVAYALGVDDPKRSANLSLHPLVVINHGFGLGFERHGVPIVDFHYLRLLLSSGSYQAGTRFERGVGMTYESVQLYGSQAELEAKLDNLLKEPPVLKRYDDTLRWRRVPFQTSTGEPFFIEMPALKEVAAPDFLRDMPSLAKRKRNHG
jgi:hypothetical protein